MHNKILIGLFGALLLTASCTNEKSCSRCDMPKRTVLVYLAGDNSLSTEAWMRRDSLLAGWNPELGTLLIAEHSWQTGQPVLMKAVWNGSKAITEVLNTYGSDANMADPTIWKQVLADAATMVPSDHFGLVMFSHATGWLPEGAYEQYSGYLSRDVTRSLLDGSGRQMNLDDFVNAIPDGMFDFILFDMCFMGSIETSYALRKKTDWIVASATEMVSPGFMPIYHQHLNKLFSMEPDLQGLARAYFAYFAGQTGKEQSATVSVINTRHLETLAEVAKKVQADIAEYPDTTGIQFYDRKGVPHLFYDLGEYLHVLDSDNRYAVTIDSTMSRTVTFRRNTPHFLNIDIKKHSGLSVYIPLQTQEPLNAAYHKTAWWQATH